MMATSLYLHLPFCLSKCGYCSFVSYAGKTSLYERYVSAVSLELARIAGHDQAREPLTTLFFGGGTPTVLGPTALIRLLSCIRRSFRVSAGAEISVEANPGTVDPEMLDRLRRAGFNRLSLGVQSFDDHELRRIGRGHDAASAVDAFRAARQAGFTNISLDLMYGLPGQSLGDWGCTLETALALAPEHLSLYQLTVDENSPLAAGLPDEETVVAMDACNQQLTAGAGLLAYEIANFARVGCQCRHNLNYWHNGPYLAAGAGAVSCVDGVRGQRLSDPERYCQLIEDGREVIVEYEQLDHEASFRETVIMGLRLTAGVSRQEMVRRFGLDPGRYYGEVVERLQRQGLVLLDEACLRVTERGRLLSNLILAELV